MDIEFKQKLLETLDEFVRISKEYKLQYYLAYGSLLGAVRDGHLIPWDDDIDILMPRPDYEKLKRLPNSIWREGFTLSYYDRTKNYFYDIIKIENTRTTLIERLSPIYVGGIFIDIFPLDGVDDDQDFRTKRNILLNLTNRQYIPAVITTTKDCTNILELFLLLIKKGFTNKTKLLDKFDKIASSSDYEHSTLVASFHAYQTCHAMPKSWLSNGRSIKLENSTYIAPKEYDLFLKQNYGDYMTPPPECNRVAHQFVYVNTERRITLEQQNIILRDIRKQKAYKINFHKKVLNQFKNIVSRF